MTAFAGHANDSLSKVTYSDPTKVAPADRLYAPDGNDADSLPDVYDKGAFSDQPGSAARSNGYPRQ